LRLLPLIFTAAASLLHAIRVELLPFIRPRLLFKILLDCCLGVGRQEAQLDVLVLVRSIVLCRDELHELIEELLMRNEIVNRHFYSFALLSLH
jgi:hypothetical protein